MPGEDLGFEIILSCSIFANLIFGFLVIGAYLKAPLDKKTQKKAKDIDTARYTGAILIGFWGGIIGNAMITAMFKIQENNTPPWFWGAVFVICVIGAILFTIFLGRTLISAVGE